MDIKMAAGIIVGALVGITLHYLAKKMGVFG